MSLGCPAESCDKPPSAEFSGPKKREADSEPQLAASPSNLLARVGCWTAQEATYGWLMGTEQSAVGVLPISLTWNPSFVEQALYVFFWGGPC